MKLKKWLILSHAVVMLIPIVLSLILFLVIVSYNNNTRFKDYIAAMNKFKVYQEKLDNPDIYNGYYSKNKKFVVDKDKSSVQIELYNALGQQIYSSDNNILNFIQKETLYSDLCKIQTGNRAYTLKMPVFKDSVLIGFYQIVIAREEFVQAVNYKTIAIISFFVLLIVSVLILVMLILNKKFNKPIKLLVEGMNKFALGDSNMIYYKYSDEIGELINHFNSMKEDIEEKRKIIELQQKSKEYMISAISHDLKTPLTAIRAYAESILNEENFHKQKFKDKMSIILKKSDYMKNMIDDLMMYNLLTTGYKMNFVSLEGSEFFEMLFSGYDESCEEKKIKLIIDINVQEKYKVDVRQITRVIDNLMANALRYTKEEGRIYMGAYSINTSLPSWLESEFAEEIVFWKKEGLIVLVKNEGDSIKDKEKEKIFMPFYQSDDSRNKKLWNGVGLGLSIVQLVIQKHDGEVRVFSKGISTTFVCWIPTDIKHKNEK